MSFFFLSLKSSKSNIQSKRRKLNLMKKIPTKVHDTEIIGFVHLGGMLFYSIIVNLKAMMNHCI